MSELLDQSTGDSPCWNVDRTELDDDSASWAIRCKGKVLIVDIATDDLGDWSRRTEFENLLRDAPDDLDAEESLLDLIYEPCSSLFRTYSPDSADTRSFTLQDYYTTGVHVFQLIGVGSCIEAVRRPDEHPMIARMSIEIALNDIPDASKLLQLDAATARIIPRQGGDLKTDSPSIISVDKTAARYFFKPADHPPSFLREFNILLQLKEERLNKKYRLPTLHGLVHYSNKPDCILGMLIDRIDNGDTLADWINGRNPARSLREKWDNQIRDIVRVLHRHRIVWGDVKPNNVIIDDNRNSWVIDFGGGYNPAYVDRDVMETLEGDLQGVSRMSAELLNWKKPMPAVHSVPASRP